MTATMSGQGATLAFESLGVHYPGRPQPALQDVSFVAQPGLVTAVVGPNGSGKSSLVRALLRRVPLASGRILLAGEPIAAMESRAMAQQVAVVPQREEPGMPLSVREFVMLGRHPHRGAFGGASREDRSQVEQAVERAGIADAIDRTTDSLSGGEWQRVRIARALAQDTPVLVLDEPTTFLDIAHEMAVFELVDALAREGRTVLLVSHQLNLVARFADAIVLLHRGRVAAAGDADAVMRGEILEAVYDWPLVVTRDPAVGAPALLPLRGRGRTR
ncbi:MAG: ABC transporter ATP-binding protein [Gemmatimonas sp.]|uniref:ABC transporter ATP-binding protein n=1 Tax=Gemmatimonas sp. TaxID=1962908 RepID=UPI0025C1AF17|nr:ABC transporter ATP-binding protein [Gemmatimonas sp.]MCE2953535.1 ABC transporter ATP-binding protein [Gemmatimonas sp.]